MKTPSTFPGHIPYPAEITSEFLESLDADQSITSIRLHPKKGKKINTEQLNPVAWCPDAFYLEERPSFTLDPAFHTGAYYVQDAGSMLLRWVLDQIEVENKSMITILDLCAAPGGKSTLIAEWLNGKGALVSNEVIGQRTQILAKNLTKNGYANVMITRLDPADLGKLTQTFDIIVVDAPCSGEGMWRKDQQTIVEWTPEHVEMCSSRQKRILEDIYPALKHDGHLIYATCAYNLLENINPIKQLCDTKQISSIELNPPKDFNLLPIEQGDIYGLQCVPGKSKGEGLFIALLKNNADPSEELIPQTRLNFLSNKQKSLLKPYINKNYLDLPYIITKTNVLFLIPPQLIAIFNAIDRKGKIIRTGILAGKLTERIFVPSHELSLSLILNGSVNKYNASKEEALAFLRKQLHKIDDAPIGWILIQYQGNTIAWAKNLGKRINNYFPKGDVIRLRD